MTPIELRTLNAQLEPRGYRLCAACGAQRSLDAFRREGRTWRAKCNLCANAAKRWQRLRQED